MPFEPNDWFSVLVTGDYFHQRGNGPGGVLVQGALAPNVDDRSGDSDPRSIAALRAAFPAQISSRLVFPPRGNGFVDADLWGVTGKIKADLGFATLIVIPAFRRSRPDYLTFSGGYDGRVIESANQTSLETRLSSSGQGPLQYVIGAYAFDEDQTTFNDVFQGNLLRTTFNTELTNRSYAVLGQASFAIAPALRLAGGARHTWDEKINDPMLTQRSFGVGPTSRVQADVDFTKLT